MKSYSHSTGSYTGKNAKKIFYQCWEVPRPKAVLIILHGLGEHSGRYQGLVKNLAGQKISVYAADQRGHGQSEGERGHVDSFLDYIQDLKLFMDIARDRAGKVPVILLGHSMGGIIACKFAIMYPETITSLILSAPALKTVLKVPSWKEKISGLMSRYFPAFSLSSGIIPEMFTHDNEEIEAWGNDRLTHDRVSARWYTEFQRQSAICLSNASELKMPVLVVHGKSDPIADFRGSEQFISTVLSRKKQLHIINGMFHELLHEQEPERSKTIKTMLTWIQALLKKKTTSKKKTAAPVVKKTSGTKKTGTKTASKKTTVKKKTAAKTKSVKKSVKKPAARKKSTARTKSKK